LLSPDIIFKAKLHTNRFLLRPRPRGAYKLTQTVDLPVEFKGSYFYRGREREEKEGRGERGKGRGA